MPLLAFCTLAAAMLVLSMGAVAVGTEKEGGPEAKEKIVLIHYKKGFGKPPGTGGGKGGTKCYNFIANGAKWKQTPVDYVIDPDNEDGMGEWFVANAIHNSAEAWDANTSMELFGGYTFDNNSSWDGDNGDTPDGRNELLFGNYWEPGVIAITVIWGNFSGPPSKREITEFDVLFDTDYTWGDADYNGMYAMDLQNIATHEIGHGIGLGDLYDTVCTEETMYGYSDYGETKKRTLNAGDITGLQQMYGA